MLGFKQKVHHFLLPGLRRRYLLHSSGRLPSSPNSRVSPRWQTSARPGLYFLACSVKALSKLHLVGSANYHMAIMRGNHVEFLRYNLDRIGHFHVAGVPGRHEPAGGETNYPRLLCEIEKSGYKGYIGLEYFPLLESCESREETKRYIQIAR